MRTPSQTAGARAPRAGPTRSRGGRQPHYCRAISAILVHRPPTCSSGFASRRSPVRSRYAPSGKLPETGACSTSDEATVGRPWKRYGVSRGRGTYFPLSADQERIDAWLRREGRSPTASCVASTRVEARVRTGGCLCGGSATAFAVTLCMSGVATARVAERSLAVRSVCMRCGPSRRLR